jgi:hypothetical protein
MEFLQRVADDGRRDHIKGKQVDGVIGALQGSAEALTISTAGNGRHPDRTACSPEALLFC